MADVTGPISTLPGTVRNSPDGMMCDNHPDRVAYRRVQGETDSMGCEMHDLCKGCYDAHLAERANADRSGYCEWCKTNQPVIHRHRDFEEGSCGPVYDVCSGCIDRERKALEAELGDDDYYDGWL